MLFLKADSHRPRRGEIWHGLAFLLQHRPREIIQFCTQAIEFCRESNSTIPVKYAAVREAEDIYSAERAKDIAAEHSGTSAWLSDSTPNSLIEILWNTGFLCAEAVQEGGASRTGSVSFLGAHQVRHLNIAAARRFQVHPMFHAYLDIGTAGMRKVSQSKRS